MEVPYVHGATNPLKREEPTGEVERFAEDFEELQKKIHDTDEKQRSRKRQQQEQVEETKRKTSEGVYEQRELSPTPVQDASFSKVRIKGASHAIPAPKIAEELVEETAKSRLQFIPEAGELPPSLETTPSEEAQMAPPSPPSEKAAAQPTTAAQVAKEELVQKPTPLEFEKNVEEVISATPLIEEKLGKEGEVEQATFTPEKSQSVISASMASSALTPYTRLTPEMMEMFDAMILHMQVMEQSDIRETTITLGGKAFEKSPLNGAKIIIREYQKSAPMQYNVEFEGSPEAMEKISKKLDALTLALAHGNYAFKVHRFETRISTKSLGQEKSPFDKEELT